MLYIPLVGLSARVVNLFKRMAAFHNPEFYAKQEGNEIKPFVQNYGMVIVDECHHVSSVSFEQVLRRVRAQYVYGLTATPIRKDGHQPIIFM